MVYMNMLYDGCAVDSVYLCKSRQTATARNGKMYLNLVLQDRTGTMDAKVWDPNDRQIGEFAASDFIRITGSVGTYNGALQMTIRSARKAMASEYDQSDYFPTSGRRADEMQDELDEKIRSVRNPHLRGLLESFFVDDAGFREEFCKRAAARSVHHACVGGLLEHSLAVASLCELFAQSYPAIDRDLLVTAALLHDVGKVRELSGFPANDYTEDGNLLGHIAIGAEMVHDRAAGIPGFPRRTELALKHCILSHHGKREFGSPTPPCLIEAIALSQADLADSRLRIASEALDGIAPDEADAGYSKALESHVRRTTLS